MTDCKCQGGGGTCRGPCTLGRARIALGSTSSRRAGSCKGRPGGSPGRSRRCRLAIGRQEDVKLYSFIEGPAPGTHAVEVARHVDRDKGPAGGIRSSGTTGRSSRCRRRIAIGGPVAPAGGRRMGHGADADGGGWWTHLVMISGRRCFENLGRASGATSNRCRDTAVTCRGSGSWKAGRR